MHPSQFDSISRLFAVRRSRRQALAVAGGSLAALGVGHGTLAQEASPAASPISDNEGVPFMFVQTFGAGSLVPLAEDEGALVLTADHLAGQTIYFSDRPKRMVGMVSTETFLGAGNEHGGLGFTPTDPPNAALVLDDGSMLVVELIEPTYDAATGKVTYQIRMLEAVEQIDLQLQQEPLSALEAPQDFAAASLFIDDCSQGNVVCTKDGTEISSFPSAFCFDTFCCAPCHTADPSFWTDQCNLGYPDCDGSCEAHYQGQFACPY